MSLTISTLIKGLLVLILGGGFGYLINQVVSSKKVSSARSKAESLLNEAKSQSQNLVLEAKEKVLKILDEAKRDEEERRKQFGKVEEILSKREKELEAKAGELNKEKATIDKSKVLIEDLKTDLTQKRQTQIAELEKISHLKQEEARVLLFKNLEEEYKEDLYSHIRKLEESNNEEIAKRAREILTTSVQRYAGSHIADFTTTIVTLPSDEVKGKIIGKEGRNIKTIERLTGVDIIIDDTPEALIISGFDPVRRQIAKIAIEKLIADGRIHPARIEETIEKAKLEMSEKIKQAGEAALFETGVGAFDPKLTFLLGRLAFRTSFGQNVLIHSIEMAHVAGVMAQELGADVSIAKKGALFHDIGKAVDHEVQGTHVEIGRKLLQKFNVDERVILAMQSHHEEYPYSTLESRIVQAADAISAARPGARRDTAEIYLKRLEDLERIANSFSGIEKSYAIQAGRELRIFVSPTKIDDLSAIKLARDIAKKIELEMKYPGEIRVNVIRETRAIEYAK